MPITLNGTTGITTPNLNSDGTVTTSSLVNGSALAFRNKIINGNFDIWQRGTSLASGTSLRFLADRFRNNSVGSTYTASQQSFSVGQTNVPNNPSFFYRTVVSSVAGSNNFATLAQPIENVQTFAGQTITFSFYAKTDSTKNISVEFGQNFGTGGSPSSAVEGIGVQKLNLTTSWQRFVVTANIPSISGKTIGTNNNDILYVNFFFDAGSNFNSRTDNLGQQSGTFDIAQLQLEEGSVATPFEVRPIGTELALCQRYYQVIGAIRIYGYQVAGSELAAPLNYMTQMRASPSVTISNFTVGNVTGGIVYASPMNPTGGSIRIYASVTGALYAVDGTFALSAEF